MGSNDFVTLFFLVAAVLIFWQLRSVLGRRTGNEKPPKDPFAGRPDATSPAAEDARVVTLPRREEADGEERQTAIDAYAPVGTPLNQQLRQVVEVDPSFVPKEFLNGARMAYEMIVTAFATGDRKSLKDLLSREVYEGFDAAITEREQRGEVMKSTFVGIDKAEITGAEVRGQEVQITVRLVSQLISATYDSQGAVIEGDAESVGDVNDIWTFARDTRSRDPNWKLIATESDQ
ncbi:Tim44/TimA family putative adaptor protein [Agrobacterium vitis]|uniref:Tim44 domain-containing protein n=1 Tax=Agrobacterium vitis TaxID=373 RepID=A0AAE2RJB7_AGRVI|nr:Tim44/TimA family putative adaptor protein [Agrobacterium vitis]MBF2717761.1 Tim44 domain-containing protein [Agrobacterium vitis]MUZ61653.1 Tim44/TimA family putative adaptor protein [Agrobacterium vitis]MVA21589.1 Tim44/TimA family putative adaptor protein [Agrobacterium vitis]